MTVITARHENDPLNPLPYVTKLFEAGDVPALQALADTPLAAGSTWHNIILSPTDARGIATKAAAYLTFLHTETAASGFDGFAARRPDDGRSIEMDVWVPAIDHRDATAMQPESPFVELDVYAPASQPDYRHAA